MINPGYNSNDRLARNDIAIVQTNKPITFNMAVGPACLPFRYSQYSFEGVTAWLLGKHPLIVLRLKYYYPFLL